MGLLNVQEPPLSNSPSISSLRSRSNSIRKVENDGDDNKKDVSVKTDPKRRKSSTTREVLRKASYGLSLQKKKLDKRRRKWKTHEKWMRTRALVIKLHSNLQEYFNDETYVVINKQDTLFRFNKSKSFFLFSPENKIRQFCQNISIRPLFAHFITVVIIANCACMVLSPSELKSTVPQSGNSTTSMSAEQIIEKYLEPAFTCIYGLEAMIKIIARGFVLHKFSYLRDPWNWIDFGVIIGAIITEILELLLPKTGSDELGPITALRAFRVLRALKTMSVVPGLRSIVKALLRSIRALKDAIVLTLFSVSIFALIGYQLFNGTLRQKCIRVPNTTDLAPYTFYVQDNGNIPDYNLRMGTLNLSDQLNSTFAMQFTRFEDVRTRKCTLSILHAPVHRNGSNPCSNLDGWNDKLLMDDIRSRTDSFFHSNSSNYTTSPSLLSSSSSLSPDFSFVIKKTNFSSQSSYFAKKLNYDCGERCRIVVSVLKMSNFRYNCSDLNSTGSISCGNGTCRAEMLNGGANHSIAIDVDMPGDTQDENAYLYNLLCLREYMVMFHYERDDGGTVLGESQSKTLMYFVVKRDLSPEEELHWNDHTYNHFLKSPQNGQFYYVGSPNRPTPEPLYCPVGSQKVCPSGYECGVGGGNPDYNYTSFDNFPLALLSSFRLVALDAWNRLYYLTLHTISPYYAIFYVIVVFLGSYYLINLILAVVYMAYEEQLTAVEQEIMERNAQEREKEKHDTQRGRGSDESSQSGSSSDSDVERNSHRHNSSATSNHQQIVEINSNASSMVQPPTRRTEIPTQSSKATSNHGAEGGVRRRKLRRRKQKSKPVVNNGGTGGGGGRAASSSPDLGCCDEDGTSIRRRKISVSLTRPSDSEADSLKQSVLSSEEITNNHKNLLSVSSLSSRRRTPSTDKRHSSCSVKSENLSLSNVSSGVREANSSVGLSQDLNDIDLENDDKSFHQPLVYLMKTLSDESSSSEPCSRNEQVVQVEISKRHDSDASSYHASDNGAQDTKQRARVNALGVGTRFDYEDNLTYDDETKVTNTVTEKENPNTASNNNVDTGLNGAGPLLYSKARTNTVFTNALYDDDDDISCNELPPVKRKKKKKGKKKTWRERLNKMMKPLHSIFCKWSCCTPAGKRIQHKFRNVVHNPFFDLFITCCIAINTLFMSMEYHPMDEEFEKILETANLVFTAVFAMEMTLKIIGLTPHKYFKERWNKFDATIVCFSLLELFLSKGINSDVNMEGLTVLRAFRLMRILKLAKQYPTLNKLLAVIGRTLGNLWNLTLVFLLVLFIFAVVGMQLLGSDFKKKWGGDKNDLPRWHFCDFVHAFMVVFRIQCGEWVENMLLCLSASNPGICIPLFITVFVIGNLVILNLFLALLLNSFSGDVLQGTENQQNSITAAFSLTKKWYKAKRKKFQHYDFRGECCRFARWLKTNSPRRIITDSGRKPADHQRAQSITLQSVDGKLADNLEKTADVIGKNGLMLPKAEPIKISYASDTMSNGHCQNGSVTTTSNNHQDLLSTPAIDVDEPSDESLLLENGSEIKDPHLLTVPTGVRARTHGDVGDFSDDSYDSRTASKSFPVIDPPARRTRRRRNSIRSSSRPSSQSAPSEDGRQSSTPSSAPPTDPNAPPGPPKEDMALCFGSWWEDEPMTPESQWYRFRKASHKVVTHLYFENIVIFLILISTVTLALDDKNAQKEENKALRETLKWVDIICCIFFTFEMLLKWAGLGMKYYFRNTWCILDFIIVVVSLLNLVLTALTTDGEDISSLRALRTFRALRPLRALSRFQGMKIVVDALVRAIPSIGHVFLVCMIFWLIFSILGVNFFGGKFGRCVALKTSDILPRYDLEDEDANFTSWDERCDTSNQLFIEYLKGAQIDASFLPVLPAVRNKTECNLCQEKLFRNRTELGLTNATSIYWQIPNVNFDTMPSGFLALLQVATFNGWVEIMANAVDATGEEEQPRYEEHFLAYIYFMIFIVFGSFFSLNLFIGVIIDNFNQQKLKCAGGEDGVFLTDEQRQYYNAMKRMAAKTPKTPIPRPDNKLANKIYDLVTDRRFDIAIMILVMLNVIVMAIEHYGMSVEVDETLQTINRIFIGLFVVEAVLKLIGLRQHYFNIGWNVFDILVVAVSLCVNIITASNVDGAWFPIQPSILRILRLFRVTRILRLVRELKGIRTLLFALAMSIPALFNIGCLLVLILVIYAIVGMSQFAEISKVAGVDDLLNFETFGNAFLVLFQASTSEGWDQFIEPMMRDEPPFCTPPPINGTDMFGVEQEALPTDCGNAPVGIGILFFVTYVMITFLIVINMYIAIILENFEVATRESAEPLTADDFEQFFEVWQRYDDRLTQYVNYEQLQHLLNQLDFPLRVPIPNAAFIANSHLKMTMDGRVHCLEVIISLIKKVLGDSPELNNLKDAMTEQFMARSKTKQQVDDVKQEDLIDSEEFTRRWRAAIILQNHWREYSSKMQDEYWSDEEGDEEFTSEDNVIDTPDVSTES